MQMERSVSRSSLAITLASVVALALVVGLHVPSLPNHWLLHCGVPWFFFASGWWLVRPFRSSENGMAVWRAEVSRRVKSLLVPYFIMNLAWFPILFAFNWVGWKYCGAHRVVDGSMDCVLRCLGLSCWQWPALVPTWFLRALFVAVALVGLCWTRLAKTRARLALVAAAFWAIELTKAQWCPATPFCTGLTDFGIPTNGMAMLATGGLAQSFLSSDLPVGEFWSKVATTIRRHLMPVYLLHVVVMLFCQWGAKASGKFDLLLTPVGNVATGVVGVVGAIALGELFRRKAPRLASIVFGGR